MSSTHENDVDLRGGSIGVSADRRMLRRVTEHTGLRYRCVLRMCVNTKIYGCVLYGYSYKKNLTAQFYERKA
jgi:hypothetical protein